MTVPEAMLILGIRDHRNLTLKELREKHRKTMLLNHPDRGGSAYLAMKINEARSVLESSNKFK
jgi:DnaJ homolog subfamily C member 19